MVEFLQAVLEWMPAGTTRIVFVCEIFLAELMFMIPSKTRSRFPLRAIGAFIAYVAMGLFCPESFLNPQSLITIPIFFVSVLLFWFCFDLPFKQTVFNCIAAYGVQGLVTRVYSIFVRVFSIPSDYYVWGNPLCCILLYAIAYFAFVRRYKKEEISVPRWNMILLSFAVLFACDLMSKVSGLLGEERTLSAEISMTLSILLALLYLFNTFYAGRLRKENDRMEEVFKAEQEQYRLSRETIDLVNMKCHDLKHQLAQIRAGMEGKDSEALKEMESAVLFYECVAKTGNSALDSILTQKNLFCERYAITFTYIADGKLLEFMKPSDIWSLLCNAIDNAIECVLKEKDEEKREIFLNVSGKDKLLSISLENYCSTPPLFQDGLPVTTKEDKDNHGIGVKSIRYLVEKYGGHTVFGYSGGLFTLDIMIPLP